AARRHAGRWPRSPGRNADSAAERGAPGRPAGREGFRNTTPRNPRDYEDNPESREARTDDALPPLAPIRSEEQRAGVTALPRYAKPSWPSCPLPRKGALR